MPVQDDITDLRNRLALAEGHLDECMEREEGLRETEARHRLLIGSWAQAFWETDADGAVVADSPSWRAYTGQTLDEWLGYGWLNAIHPEDRCHADGQWRDAIATRGLVDAEFRLRAPDGGWRWTNVRAAPVLDAGGQIKKWVGMNIDIDARKQAETALRESEQALASDLANAERLRSLSERLVSEESFQVIYGEILSATVAITRADAGTIQIYDPATRSLELIASQNFPRTITDYFHRVDAGSGTACGIALKTGERAFVDFPDEAADLGCQLLAGEGIQSAAAFPLVSRTGTPLGMLNGHWRQTRHRPNESELRYLDLLARQAADLIEQRRSQSALRESEERQTFLLKFSDALRTEPDEAAIVGCALRTLANELGLDRCYATILYPEEDRTDVIGEFRKPGFTPMPLTFRNSDFPEAEAQTFRGTLILNDTANDPKLTDTEKRSLVAMSFAAFLSSPLRHATGYPFWSLGAVSSQPRRWTSGEVSLMEEATERTWTAVERARAEKALRNSERLRRAALSGGRMGSWRWDRGADLIQGDEQFMALWGLPPSDDALPLATFVARMSAQGAAEMAEIVARAVAANEEFSGSLAIASGPKAGSWVQWQGRAAPDDPSVLYGVTLDITGQRTAEARLRESEERYRTVFESMDEGFCIIEMIRDSDDKAVDYRFLEVNPAFAAQTGLDDVVNRNAREVAPSTEDYWIDAYGEVARTGKPVRFEQYHEGTGRWYDVRVARLGGPGDERVCIVFDDMTNRRRIEATLRESEQRFREFGENSSDALWIINTDTMQLEYLSPAFERIWGERREAVMADISRWAELTHPDDRAAASGAMPRLLAGETLQADYRIIRPDGEVRWIRDAGFPISEGGIVKRGGGIAQDVTDLKRAEAAVRESEARLRDFGNASQDVLWIRDAETLQWQYLTPAFETIYGLSREKALSGNNYRSWLELIVPEDREHVMENIQRVKTGQQVAFEFRTRRPFDGAIRWMRNTDFPIKDEAGTVTLIGGIGHDFTELREAELRLQALIEGIPQLVWRADHCTLWTWASPQWTAFTGRDEVASHGLGWLESLHPDDRDTARMAWSHAIERGELQVEYRIADRRGAYRWFQTRAVPVRDKGGVITEWLGTSTDIHELRQLQDRQRVMVQELQHRTRNLITVISALSKQTLKNAVSLGDFDHHFSDRLSALSRVQGLLSHLSAGKRVTFDDLLGSELTALGAPEDKVTLDGPKGVPLRSAMVQTFSLALHELGTNALKYGALAAPNGHLTVVWEVTHSNQDGPRLRVNWRETGVVVTHDGDRPRSGGYGRELIERALPYQLDADTTYEMAADGVHCTIDVPASTVGTELD